MHLTEGREGGGGRERGEQTFAVFVHRCYLWYLNIKAWKVSVDKLCDTYDYCKVKRRSTNFSLATSFFFSRSFCNTSLSTIFSSLIPYLSCTEIGLINSIVTRCGHVLRTAVFQIETCEHNHNHKQRMCLFSTRIFTLPCLEIHPYIRLKK